MAETAPGARPETGVPTPENGPAEPRPERPGRRRLPALLLVLLLAAGFWIVWQARSNRALEARVLDLSGQLAVTREELAAYHGHLGEVRDRVADLRAELDELDEVVRRDPAAGPPPGTFE